MWVSLLLAVLRKAFPRAPERGFLLPWGNYPFRQPRFRNCAAAFLLHFCHSCCSSAIPTAPPAAPLPMPSAVLSGDRHIFGFASWNTQLWLCWARNTHLQQSSVQKRPGHFIFLPSFFLISLEDLTINQHYSFAEMHRTFIQFDRSVQIFQKDKKAQKGTKQVCYCITHRQYHESESKKLSDFYTGKQWSFRRVQLTEAYYLSPFFSSLLFSFH